MDPTTDGKKVPDQTNKPDLAGQDTELKDGLPAEQATVAVPGQEGGLIEVEHTSSEVNPDAPSETAQPVSPVQSSSTEPPLTDSSTPNNPAPIVQPMQTDPIQAEPAPIAPSPVPQPMVVSPDGVAPYSPPSQQPVAGQPFIGGMDTNAISPLPVTPANSSKKPKKLYLAAAVVAVVVILGLGYTFAIYLPNTPGNVYNAGLKNTGVAVDKLADYFTKQANTNVTGMTYDGTMNVKTSSASFDGSLKGAIDKDGNSNNHLDADIVGEKIGVDLLSVHVSGNTTNDLYFKVSGASDLLNNMGANYLDGLDGQWISVDHTLIDSYVNDLSSSAGGDLSGSSFQPPTTADIEDAFNKMQVVNKQYLFTNNSQTAVFVNKKFVGTETKDGQKQNHYQVGFNKDNLASYLDAVGKALDSSKLNSWVKNTGDSTNISDSMGIKDMENKVKQMNADSYFDMWVNTKTKLIGDIQFTDATDGTKLTIAQAYNGGSIYPFSISISNSPEANGSINFTIDSNTNKYALAFSLSSGKSSGDDLSLQGKLNFSPSNQPVKVTAPSDATPITDVLSQGFSGASSFTSNPLLGRSKLINL